MTTLHAWLWLTLIPAPQDEAKIDPTVKLLAERREVVPVILLGKTQLLETPAGFEAFCRKNAGRKRRELRKEVIGRLKEIASKEHEAILKAIGNPEGARGFWIVNAILARIRSADLPKAAALDAVRYIYPGDITRPPGPPGTVSKVLETRETKPFTLEGKKVPWNLKEIGADRVWTELKITGKGAVVAMLDAGVNYAHEDLQSNIWINPGETPNNARDDDRNGLVDDYYGYNFITGSAEVRARGPRQHGTWTSGIVAGDGTGGTLTGVAPRSKLMLLMGMSTLGGALSYQYALENGADVINMSFSIPRQGNRRGLWRMMSENAVCAGLVLVSGAGNFQQQARIPVQLRIPEGIPCVIAAGGVGRGRKVPPFCSLGPVEWGTVKFYGDAPMPDGLVKPDVCGFPGPLYPLLSAADHGYVDPNRFFRGNSFSGPHVSGVAALMLSAAPDLPAWRVKEIMEKTATDLGDKGKDNRTGAGLLNAYEAVKEALRISGERK